MKRKTERQFIVNANRPVLRLALPISLITIRREKMTEFDKQVTVKRKATCECGGNFYHYGTSEESGNRVWVCANCLTETKRKSHVSEIRKCAIQYLENMDSPLQ
jgi:hypothetical protein